MVEQAVSINFDDASGLEVMKALRTYLNHSSLVANTDDSKIIAAFTPDEEGKLLIESPRYLKTIYFKLQKKLLGYKIEKIKEKPKNKKWIALGS